MTPIYRILIGLTPPPASAWLRAHAAEHASIEDPRQKRRWALGAFSLFLSALWRQLKHQPNSYLGGTLVKTIVATLSLVNLIAGLTLLGAYIAQADSPIMMLTLAAVLIIQGAYSLVLLPGALGRLRDPARLAQVAGSTVAVLAGAIGFAVGFAQNIAPANNDPEYGPMAVALLIGAHGLVSLLTFSTRPAV